MKIKWHVCFWLIAVGSLCAASAQERPADEVIKVNTALVSVPVIVSDRQGRYIPDLARTDFGLLQDGKEQSIEFFAAAEEPISVALLIDTSQSTRKVLDDIKSAANKLIKLLQPNDKGMIVSFDHDVHVLSALTSDQDQLKRAVKKAQIPDGLFGTLLRDAVVETVNVQFARVTGRKAIILLTDGKDHGSYVSAGKLRYSLQESDVTVYTVLFTTGKEQRPFRPDRGRRRNGDIFGGRGRGGVFGGRIPRDERMPPFPRDGRRDDARRRARIERVEVQNEHAQEFLQDLSGVTAGRFYESKSSKLKEVFAAIVDELRHQYRLGYYPPEEEAVPAIHTIRVEVMRPDVVVRARASYKAKTQ